MPAFRKGLAFVRELCGLRQKPSFRLSTNIVCLPEVIVPDYNQTNGHETQTKALILRTIYIGGEHLVKKGILH